MQPTLEHDMSPDTAPPDIAPSDITATARPHRIVASLVTEADRPLIHLATIGGHRAEAAEEETPCALGIVVSETVTWNAIGHVRLNEQMVERALVGGLSVVAIQHVREAGVQLGDAVLVFGADPWALLLLQWARLQGASPLVFACREAPWANEQSSSFGLDAQLSDPTASDLARVVKLTHRGNGFALAIDAIANEKSMPLALAALRDGGRYVLAGLHPQPQIVLNAYPDLHRRDLEVSTLMHPASDTDFASLFRFGLGLEDEGRLRLRGVLDPASGWRVVSSGTGR